MEFNIFDWDLAEPVYWFMEDRFDEFSAYLAEGNTDCSLAEYVSIFHLKEFKEYCESIGYVFDT